MRIEVHSAANFLVQLLRIKPDNGLSDFQLNMLKLSISEVLCRRYEEHWFPEKPTKGSGYRCIRINKSMDPVLAQAGLNIGLPIPYLTELFPRELTLWVDPAEVSYRIGEDGSICVLYEEKQTAQVPLPASGPTNIPPQVPSRVSALLPTMETIPNVGLNSNNSGSNSSAGCKEAMLILDPHNASYSFEQTTYVSG